MNKLYLWSAVLALTFISLCATAQINITNCPSTSTIESQSANSKFIYNNALFSDSFSGQNDLGEAEMTQSVEVQSTCPITSATFLIKLDLDGDGIVETLIDSENLQAAGQLSFNNMNGAGTVVSFDTRPVPSARIYQFGIQCDTLTSGNIELSIVWTEPNYTVPSQIPYGQHSMEWKIQNDCGDTATCMYDIEVLDKKPPTVVCQNGVSINVINTNPPFVHFWASDVIQYVIDNYSQESNIEYAICLDNPNAFNADICSGSFPLNPDGTSDTMITLACVHLGSVSTQVWAKDVHGNTGFCEAIVSVQDNMGVCGGTPTFSDSVCVYAKSICVPPNVVSLIPNFDVSIIGNHPSLPPTNLNYASNCFSTTLPIGGDYTIVPEKNDDWTQGLTVFDLLTIQKHLLGIAPFSNPYIMIAADANKSGSITPTDIIELRKLILGIYPSGIPNNTSWRFVDESYVFSNPSNPFSSAFPEIVSASSVSDSVWFWGIKIGDTDCSHIPKLSSEPSFLSFKNQIVEAEQTYTIRLTSNEIQAIQGTLEFDGAELLNIEAVENCTQEELYANTKENAATFAWIGDDSMVFDVKIRTKKAGILADIVRLSDRITPCIGMSKEGSQTPLELKAKQHAKSVCFATRTNCPNWEGFELADFVIGGNTANPTYGNVGNDGTYCFGDILPNKEVRFEKKDDVTNGVNTYDIILIRKHLNGTNPFTKPEQFIAADIDGSKSITGADTIELRKLILGIYPSELPNVDSWAFIPESYTFPDPMNPFANQYPNSIHLKDAKLGFNYFQAIKIGDLDTCPIFINPLKSKIKFADKNWLTANLNRSVKSGEIIELTFGSTMELIAMQGTLKGEGLELLNVTPKQACLSEDFYLDKKSNSVRFAWSGEGKPIFIIKARALKVGVLSEMIKRDDAQTKWAAYEITDNSNRNQQYPKVSVRANRSASATHKISPISAVALPSVFSENTRIKVEIAPFSKDKPIELRVYDNLGKLVHEDFSCKSVECIIEISSSDLPTTGIYSVHIQAENELKVLRIIRQ